MKRTSLLSPFSKPRELRRTSARLVLRIACAALWCAILSASPSRAESYLVSPGQSISQALTELQPGDTLLVRAGVYRQSIVLPRDGEAGRPIVLKNYPGEKPVIMNNDRLIDIDRDHWIIEGLILDQQMTLTDAVKIRGQHVTIRNCEIRNGAKDGIDGSDTSSDILIENCVIHDFIRPSGDDAHGIVVNPGAQRWQIIGNTIYDCGGDCIQLYASDETPVAQYSKDFLISGNTLYTTLGERSENALDFKGVDGCVVERNDMYGFDNKAWVVQKGCRNITGRENLIHDSQRGIEFRGEGGKSQQNISLIRNILYNIRDYYVIKFDDVRNVEVYHNTLVNNTATPIQIDQEGIRGGTIRNNLFYRCDAADIDGVFEGDADHNGWFATDPGDLAGDGDVNGDDPRFKDADSTDFRLQEDSPAVDTGVDVGLPFSGSAPDLGAFEVSALTTPVDMAPFSVEASGPFPVLRWRVEDESQLLGYLVERKSTGEPFTRIAYIAATGGDQQGGYEYIDRNVGPGKLAYRIAQMSLDGRTDYSLAIEVTVSGPAEFALYENYPNPFILSQIPSRPATEQTKITFHLHVASSTTLTIHDLLGREVRVLHDGLLPAGRQVVTWNGRDERGELVAAGVYFYRLETGRFGSTEWAASRPMAVVR